MKFAWLTGRLTLEFCVLRCAASGLDQGLLTYQDRQPGMFLHAMIALASGAEPRILCWGPGMVQLFAYGSSMVAPL